MGQLFFGKYEGEFKQGKRDGKGAHYYPDGRRYVGEFKQGKRDGKGIEHYADNSMYQGIWS